MILDDGLVKADSEYTGRSLRALQQLGFQLIIGAPRERPPRSRTSSTWSPAWAPRSTSAGPAEAGPDADPAEIPASELDALGLRTLPREIGVILADPVLRAAAGGLRQSARRRTSLPATGSVPARSSSWKTGSRLSPGSDTAGPAVIHSLGNHRDVLGRLP